MGLGQRFRWSNLRCFHDNELEVDLGWWRRTKKLVGWEGTVKEVGFDWNIFKRSLFVFVKFWEVDWSTVEQQVETCW